MDCRGGFDYVVIERRMVAIKLYRVKWKTTCMEYVQKWSSNEQPETERQCKYDVITRHWEELPDELQMLLKLKLKRKSPRFLINHIHGCTSQD